MGQEQSSSRVMHLVLDELLTTTDERMNDPAPHREGRTIHSWAVFLNGLPALMLDGSTSFTGYSELRAVIMRAAENTPTDSISPITQHLASGCFLFYRSHPMLDEGPISMLSEKSNNVFMPAVSNSKNNRRIHLVDPEAVWSFSSPAGEDGSRFQSFQVPLLLSDRLIDVTQHLSKRLAQATEIICAPLKLKQISVEQCLKSMNLQTSFVEFELHINTQANTIKLVCCSQAQIPSTGFTTSKVSSLTDDPRFKELEQITLAAERIDTVIKHFEKFQADISDGADLMEKFNFDLVATSLRFISNVGEMVPFISSACKVLTVMTAYIDSLEETKNDMAQLKKHSRLLEGAINLKVKVFFDDNSRWIVDDETCLACYKINLNHAVDALSSAIKRLETYSREGLFSKAMNRSRINLKSEERKLDFALKALTILDPFQLAFDMSQIEHCFQSADAKRFWKKARFRDNVTVLQFMSRLQLYCSLDLSEPHRMAIIQAVDVNMDGYVDVKEFGRLFNANSVRDTVELLLKSETAFEFGDLKSLCNPTDYAADAVDLLRDYVPDTRDSLLNDLAQMIQNFTKNNAVFVLHATAGFGKSVIAAKLASLSKHSQSMPDVAATEKSSWSPVVDRKAIKLKYLLFFFRHDDRETRTFDQFLTTLAYQICCHLKSKHFKDRIEAALRQENNETSLKSGSETEKQETLLNAVVEILPSMNNVVILVDACDECSADTLQSLLDFVRLASKEKRNSRNTIRFVLTVRNDQNSGTSKYEDFISMVRDSAENYITKLKPYFNIKVQDLEDIADFPNEKRNKMAVQIYFESSIPHLSQRGCEILVEKSNGNMLWARIALNVIRDACMDADVTYIAHNFLKPDMGSLYLEFFKSGLKLRSRDPADLKRLLSIVACAVKPLLRSDVQGAWGFAYKEASEKSNEEFAQVLVYPLCRLMIRTNAKGFLFLGHKSLRDMVDSSFLSQFVDTNAGHENLALYCLEAIIQRPESEVSDSFQTYALEHWFTHVVASGMFLNTLLGHFILTVAGVGCTAAVTEKLNSVTPAMLSSGKNIATDGWIFLSLRSILPPQDMSQSVRNMLRAQDGDMKYKEIGGAKFPAKTFRLLSSSLKPVIANSYDATCASRCFAILRSLKYNMAELPSPYYKYEGGWIAELGISYAAYHWCRHFSAVSDATGLLDELFDFCKENLLHWIETMLLMLWDSPSKVDLIIEPIATTLKKLKPQTEENLDKNSKALGARLLLFDALDMLREFKDAFNHNPLQIYHSAVIWSPLEMALHETFYETSLSNYHIPELVVFEGRVLMTRWKPWRALIAPTEMRADIERTDISHKQMEEPMNPATSVAVSSDFIAAVYKAQRAANTCNRWIVAGNSDGYMIVQLLHENGMRNLGLLEILHPDKKPCKRNGIASIAVSRDDSGNPKLIAAASLDNEVTLWDCTNGFQKLKALKEHKSTEQSQVSTGHILSVQTVAFSNDSTFLAAGSADGAVTLWTADGEFVTKLTTLNTSICTFIKDPLAKENGKFRVWSTDGQNWLSILTHISVTAVAISSNGKMIAAGGKDPGTINLWKKHGSNCKMVSSKLWNKDTVVKLEFTRDSAFLVSAVKNEVVQVWNMQSESIAIATPDNVKILAQLDYKLDKRPVEAEVQSLGSAQFIAAIRGGFYVTAGEIEGEIAGEIEGESEGKIEVGTEGGVEGRIEEGDIVIKDRIGGYFELRNLNGKSDASPRILKHQSINVQKGAIAVAVSKDGHFAVCATFKTRTIVDSSGVEWGETKLLVFSLETNALVMDYEPKIVKGECKFFDISPDGSIIAVVTSTVCYLWDWALGKDHPVQEVSWVIKAIGVSEDLLVWADDEGLQIRALDETKVFQQNYAGKDHVQAIEVTGSSQIVITRRKYIEYWSKSADTWALTFKKPCLFFDSYTHWICHGSTDKRVCWVPWEKVVVEVIENKFVVIRSGGRCIALVFHHL
ncbi:WD40-repeat-containing domain protein [Chytriomyces cf. hyalinus JEL632]|nr:WD40-repeat-containing domain protein [Chytriomyces cf. hyalinus JEL632]